MAYSLRRSDDQGVPKGAIRSPDEDDYYVAVLDSEGENAFGLAMQEPDGDVEAWFAWAGEEIHKKGDDFSFLVQDPDYTYNWVLFSKYLKNPAKLTPLTGKNDQGHDVTPASFAGRLGRINLNNLSGRTSFGGEPRTRTPEEVQQAKILCVRRKHQQCPVDYHPTQEGAYPPADAVRAKQCKYKSFVVLSTDYDPAQFGRASLNLHRDGLQAWFPYGGDEDTKESFHVLRREECASLYWAPIRAVHENPDSYEIVKYGQQSPAVMDGILGKAHISELQGWVGEDGEERGVDQDAVLEGTVLCYKDHVEHEHDH